MVLLHNGLENLLQKVDLESIIKLTRPTLLKAVNENHLESNAPYLIIPNIDSKNICGINF